MVKKLGTLAERLKGRTKEYFYEGLEITNDNIVVTFRQNIYDDWLNLLRIVLDECCAEFQTTGHFLVRIENWKLQVVIWLN